MTWGRPTWPRFSAAEMSFSAKSFAAAMLAGYVAQWAGLPRPFWSLLTAYVVASPFAGMVRSKAVFRFAGTFVGSVATLAIVPALCNAPELLSLALSLWVAVCLYVSLLDRTPRAYAFMLAGYTAALIGFPSVQTPTQVFDTATARVLEIGLGILCASLVHSIVWPASLKATVIGLLDRSVADARDWFSDLMAFARTGAAAGEGASGPALLGADRRRLAADVTQLRTLSTHVPFDTGNLRFAAGALRLVQDGVTALTPLFASVEDRLRALRDADGALPQPVAAVLAQVQAWIDGSGWQDAPRTAQLRQAVQSLANAAGEDAGRWRQALFVALAVRLEQLIEGWQATIALRADVDLGLAGNPAARRRNAAAATERVLHLDRGMAALSALAAFLAIGLSCAFWILTGWAGGAGAAMMAAIFCCFFAGMDNPVPAIHAFLKATLWSVPIALVYVLVLMPLVQDMFSLALACAPVFLLLGCYVARPATAGAAMAMLFGVAGVLSARDTHTADFAAFANSIISQVVGIVIAARVTALVRSVGAEWMARRLQRATWRELADMARHPAHAADAVSHAARTLDRIGLIAPRVTQAGGTAPDGWAQSALRDLRMGLDIAVLQRDRSRLPHAAAGAVAALMREAAACFARRAGGHVAAPSAAALGQLDAALAAMLPLPAHTPAQTSAHTPAHTPALRSAVAALVGLRSNLFAQAQPPLADTATVIPSTKEAFA